MTSSSSLNECANSVLIKSLFRPAHRTERQIAERRESAGCEAGALQGKFGDPDDRSLYSLARERSSASIAPFYANNLSPTSQLFNRIDNRGSRFSRRAGDVIEATVFERLTRLQQPTNLRRFDVADDSDIADTALPLARAADTFVALRPTVNRTNPKA